MNRGPIEAKAKSQAIAALSDTGINTSSLNIQYNGLDASISGGSSAELRDRIYDIVKVNDGVWGNVTVNPPESITELPPVTPSGNFGSIRLEYDDNSVKIDGTVSSEENRDAINKALVSEFGSDRVENNLQIDSSHDAFPWIGVIPQILSKIRSGVTNGGLEAKGTDFSLFGTVPTGEDGSTIEKEIADLAKLPGLTNDLDISAAQFAINRALAGKSIEFEATSTKLYGGGMEIVDQVITIMKRYPEVSVAVEGHTDNAGEAQAKMAISRARAQSCMDYMLQKGIDDSRVSFTGFGDERPIRSNETNEGRAKNRRVSFTVN